MPTKKISKKELWFGENFFLKSSAPDFAPIILFPTFGAFILSAYFLFRFIKFNENLSFALAIVLLAFVLIEVFFRIFKKKRFFVEG